MMKTVACRMTCRPKWLAVSTVDVTVYL